MVIIITRLLDPRRRERCSCCDEYKILGARVIAPDSVDNDWNFDSEDEETLQFIGAETLEFDGTKIAAKHYAFGNEGEAKHLWVAGPGVLVKISGSEPDDVLVLANYKQYKALIPGIKVDKPSTSR
jgi:hypothetical protein